MIFCLHTRVQVHPWFKGVPWDRLYEMEAAFKPVVTDALDTQNFEKFEEVYLHFFVYEYCHGII